VAHLCERRHALDEAEELTARVLRLESSSPAGQLLQARIQRRRGDFDAAESSLTRLTAAAPSGSSELTEAYGELSVLLDAIGQYDRAWDATLRCKQIQRTQEASAWYAAQFVTNRFRQATEEVTSRHFARWNSSAPAESPARVAVLTGFPRSGTTLLEQVLDAHPAAVSVEETEVFSDEALLWLSNGLPPETPVLQMLNDQSPERLTAARERYLQAMESMVGAPLGDRLLVDKNPALNLLIPALRRVFPEIKIIMALRDPRDVVVSCFLRRMPVNPVSVWYLTLDRTAQRYLIDVTAWLKLREQIGDWVEVRYEQSVADLPTEAARMLAAMELPWDDAVLAYRDRAETRPVFSPTYEAVAQPLYASSIGRWCHYERHLAPVLDALMPIVKLLGYDA
jgi:hypothetical protein